MQRDVEDKSARLPGDHLVHDRKAGPGGHFCYAAALWVYVPGLQLRCCYAKRIAAAPHDQSRRAYIERAPRHRRERPVGMDGESIDVVGALVRHIQILRSSGPAARAGSRALT